MNGMLPSQLMSTVRSEGSAAGTTGDDGPAAAAGAGLLLDAAGPGISTSAVAARLMITGRPGVNCMAPGTAVGAGDVAVC